MPATLSLFGDAFEPADVPDLETCPACGSATSRYVGGRCARCRAAGISAPTLPLAADVEDEDEDVTLSGAPDTFSEDHNDSPNDAPDNSPDATAARRAMFAGLGWTVTE